jgi:hypothetical protein
VKSFPARDASGVQGQSAAVEVDRFAGALAAAERVLIADING